MTKHHIISGEYTTKQNTKLCLNLTNLTCAKKITNKVLCSFLSAVFTEILTIMQNHGKRCIKSHFGIVKETGLDSL